MLRRIVVCVVIAVSVSAICWSQGIQETVFYDSFELGDTSGWWAPARAAETGQKTCYGMDGTTVQCAGTGQDGDTLAGVAWPSPRFIDNGDGTVTDMLTALVWLKDGSCAGLPGTDSLGRGFWDTALTAAASLSDGTCGLTDGSVTGDWRLPTIKELGTLVDFEYSSPAISNAAGTGQMTDGDPFSGVDWSYWSSTSSADDATMGWYLVAAHGQIASTAKTANLFVWPVRGPR